MKKLKIVLLLEGILSIVLAYLMFYTAGLQSSLEILSKPFDWIGNLLRWLSLSSSIGNLFAFVCYILISLIPMIYLATVRRKVGIRKVDILLPVISIYLFYMLYEFINPGLMLQRVPQVLSDTSILPLMKLTFSIIFYSLLLGYLIIRMVGSLAEGGAEDHMQFLCRGLRKILFAVSVVYTFYIGYFATFQMFTGIGKYVVTDPAIQPIYSPVIFPNSSVVDQFMAILTYFLQCLPIIYSILILIYGITLLNGMTLHHMKEEEFRAAEQLSNISRKTVYVTVFSNLTINIVQFLLTKQLSDTMFHMEIILTPLIIAFSAMILSGYFKETKELQEENEMII
jgi:hypothetical protein